MKTGITPGPQGNLYLELTNECKCGAHAYSRGKLAYQPITPDRMTGMWVVAEVLLPVGWRLDIHGQPYCPMCAGT